MKRTIPAAALLAAAVLSFSNCSQNASPYEIQGDYAKTKPVSIDRTDCKLICGRVSGESKGFSLLGFIPLSYPSETTSLENMYENARRRGVNLEGESVAFANTSVERHSHYYILWSRPTVKTSGDIVQYVNQGGNSKKK